MSSTAWDASDLLGALRLATATLRADIDEVNALNVFPVPDGDTGSNMLATMHAAVEQASSLSGPERDVPAVAQAVALGALVGARGNSGVILSQLMRGIADALRDRELVDGTALAAALEGGCRAAFAAVAHPVEGTMLTVSRDVADAAHKLANNGAALEDVLVSAVEAATRSVERTPQLLRVLAEAGVVDAGGRGLELLLRGALAYQRGEPVPAAPHDPLAFPSFAVDEDVGYGYETVFLVAPDDGAKLDPEEIRQRLDTMGESVLVAGNELAVKVHIHNQRPDEVLAYGLSLGTLNGITVENLDRQTHEMRWRGRQAPSGEPVVRELEGSLGPAVVAVAAGPGLARLFGELGAAGVITGGQGANPSTGALVEAIRATGSGEVIVLPNNPNVRMAAKQAGELLPDVRVLVVPTRNAAEGVAAMLAHKAAADIEANAARMGQAGKGLQTMQVTTAVRDARIGRRKVKRGQHIVLGGDEGLLAADADRQAAVIAAARRLRPGFELATLYYGEEVSGDDAEALAAALAEELPDVEFEIVDGGQPHYSFLISFE